MLAITATRHLGFPGGCELLEVRLSVVEVIVLLRVGDKSKIEYISRASDYKRLRVSASRLDMR
jgi:hypothetical protein